MHAAQSAVNRFVLNPGANRSVNSPKWARSLGFFCALSLLQISFPYQARAEAALDNDPVKCTLQSSSLNFGRITLHRSALVQGEGEVVVGCQNISQEVQSVELFLGFSTIGSHTAVLRSAHDALAVNFFLDAQFSDHWGDGANGAKALQMMLKLGPGEHRLLRLPVHALLQNRRDAQAGMYVINAPIKLTTYRR
jgi:hypothetical protein